MRQLVGLTLLFGFIAMSDGIRISTKIFAHKEPIATEGPKNVLLAQGVVDALKLQLPQNFTQTFLDGKYTFQSKNTLIKALLHPAYGAKTRGSYKDSYEPLDHIGGIALDYMISRHIMLNSAKFEAKEQAAVKGILTRQDFLAFIAIKRNLDKFIFVEPSLVDATSVIAKYREAIKGKDLYLDILEDSSRKRPNSGAFIHRQFKAIIGAVYVDSGYDIEKTDSVIIPLMKQDIDDIFNKIYVRKEEVQGV